MAIGIALSGGGAKGDFEVGALHYLYDQGIRPQVVTSTSVGSVNGLKLCEGEGTPDQGLAGLTKTWLSLNRDSDFFSVEPWLDVDFGPAKFIKQYAKDFAALNPHNIELTFAVNGSLQRLMPAELAAVEARRDATAPLGDLVALGLTAAVQATTATFVGGSLVTPTGTIGTLVFGTRVIELVDRVASLANDLTTKSSIFNLNPTRSMATAMLDLGKVAAWAAAGNKLRMAAVGLFSGELRYITEQGHIVDRAGRAQPGETVPPSQCRAEAAEVDRLSDLLDAATSGPRPSPKAVILRAQLEVARAALDRCQIQNPPTRVPLQVSLIDGMIASASIPVFFPIVGLGGDVYVDGGVREVIPVEAAFENRASTVYAISASKADIDPWGRSNSLNMANIALRSLMDIAINEVAFSDLHGLMTDGRHDVKAIYPRVDIHTIYAIYPAFVRNRMAYGYMCAADAVAPPSDSASAARARAIADRISILRYGVARLECWASHQPIPPTNVIVPWPAGMTAATLYADISAMKTEIGALVNERIALGAAMPSNQTDWGNSLLWSTRPEAHPWSTAIATNDSTLNSTVPTSVASGATFRVQVQAFNTGTSNWTVADGFALTVKPGFGVAPIPVPSNVVPGASCQFSFNVAAPSTASADFSCQMAQNGSAFGMTTIPVRVVVTNPAEPTRCKAIRTEIGKLRAQIDLRNDSLTGDARTDAPVRAAIARLNLQISALQTEGRGLGCSL